MQDLAYWSGWRINRPMDNPGAGDATRAYQRKLAKYRDENEALELLANAFPDLAAGKPNVRLDDSALVPLFDRLLEQQTGRSLHRQHNFLVQGLMRGCRELDWDLSVPAPMTIVPKELPPMTPEGFARLAFFDRLVSEHLSNGLAQRIDKHEPAWAWGQFLFCLLAEGTLLNRQWLKTLPDALTRGMGHHSDQVYLTLCRAPSDKADNDNPIYRRVFLGPVASLVLLRNYSAFGQHWPIGVTLETCLRQYCRSLSRPGDTLPRRLLSYLLDACATAASQDYPPFLVHYAKQSELGVSLPPEAWQRLCTQQLTKSELAQYDDNNENGPTLGSLPLPHASDACPDQRQRLRQLQACFTSLPRAGKSRRFAVRRRLNDFLDAPQNNSPILHLLANWCLHMLSQGGRVKKRLAIGTIRTYLSRIAAPLVNHAGGAFDNLAQLTEEDWQALYEAVLAESRGHNNRLQRARQLVDFHSFVASHYAVPFVHLEYGGQSQRHVDANLLTPAEYQRTLNIQAHSNHPKRTQRMLALALMLGYRCGLRRDEVASLLVRDIQGLDEETLSEPELIVRPNAAFAGKSVSARRRLPLRLLLTPIEQQELASWLAQRRAEANTGNSLQQLLFCAFGEPNRKLGDAELFQPIQLAMRIASGDVDLRFHHLRHSFVSFTLLRILEQAPEQLLPRAWAEDDQRNIALPYWEKDFSHAAQLAPSDQTTRKRLWALALWAGHAGPHETLASYAHLVDWTLGRYAWLRHDPVLSNPIQSALLNRSEKSLSVWRHRSGLKGGSNASQVSSLLMKRWEPYVDRSIETQEWVSYTAPQPQALQTSSQHLPRNELTAMGIYSVLRSVEQAQARGEALDSTLTRIEEHHSVPRDTVRGWLAQGYYLMSLKTSRGASRFSRKKSQQTVVFTKKGNPDLSMCIAPPTSPREQQRANTYYQTMVDLLDKDPERHRPAIAAWVASMQRSKGQVVLSERNMQTVLPLYRALGLTPHLRLSVEIDQTSSLTAVRGYWVQSLDIDAQAVQIRRRVSNQTTRSPYGRASLQLAYGNQSGAAATQLLSTLRFALFVSLLVRPAAFTAEPATLEAET